jgi:hypothetical protein
MVQGLTQEEVKSEDFIFKWLEQGRSSQINNLGENVKKVAETKLNEASSRSHTIFTIRFELNTKDGVRTSEINLVDLAGSENANKAQTEGIRFREGSNINKSLLALSNVIHDLGKNSKKQNGFVSFRSSKLTRILQKALSGNSKTIIICTINQLYSNQLESLNTLKFGTKAKLVKTKFSVNRSMISKNAIETEFSRYLEKENEKLKEKIRELEEEIRVRIFNPVSPTKSIVALEEEMNEEMDS